MKPSIHRSLWPAHLIAIAVLGALPETALAQLGTILAGTGPVNRSFGGVSVAAPLDASGAMYWNAAAITGLERSELDASLELLIPSTEVSSRVPAGALGPGFPPVDLAGSTFTDSGVYPMPTIGLAYLPPGSRWSFGFGTFALAGFGVNYPGSATNPVLTAPPPVGLGLGPVFSQFQLYQIHPALAYNLTDRWSIAAGPTIDLATLIIDPAVTAVPDDANGDGFATYPNATHGKTTWGGGFAVGTYYQAETWSAGASFKSPQWLDAFRYNSSDELGRPREIAFRLDLPMIISVGAAYTGFDRWLFATDVRYIDYKSADGLGASGFSPSGNLMGVGWKGTFAVALGAQYELGERVTLRAGYGWNQNQIPSAQSFPNTVSPLFTNNSVSVGASWSVTENFLLSVSYLHVFKNSIDGPIFTPAGAIPGSVVTNSAAADSITFGAQVRFGGRRCAGCDQL